MAACNFRAEVYFLFILLSSLHTPVLGKPCCGLSCRYYDSIEIGNCSLCGKDLYLYEGHQLTLPCRHCDDVEGSTSNSLYWMLYRSKAEDSSLVQEGAVLNLTFDRQLSGTYYCRDANNGQLSASQNVRYCAAESPRPELDCEFTIPSTMAISCRWRLLAPLDDHCTTYSEAYLTSDLNPELSPETRLELQNDNCFTDCLSVVHYVNVSASHPTASLLGGVADPVTITVVARNRLEYERKFTYTVPLLTFYKPNNKLEIVYFDGDLLEVRARIPIDISDGKYCDYVFRVASNDADPIEFVSRHCPQSRHGTFVHQIIHLATLPKKASFAAICYRLRSSHQWSDPYTITMEKMKQQKSCTKTILAWMYPFYYIQGSKLGLLFPNLQELNGCDPKLTLRLAWDSKDTKETALNGYNISFNLPKLNPITIRASLYTRKFKLITVTIKIAVEERHDILKTLVAFRQEHTNKTVLKWSAAPHKYRVYLRVLACVGTSWSTCTKLKEERIYHESYISFEESYRLFGVSVCTLFEDYCSKMIFPKWLHANTTTELLVSVASSRSASGPSVIVTGMEPLEWTGIFTNYSIIMEEARYPCNSFHGGFRCYMECLSLNDRNPASVCVEATGPLFSVPTTVWSRPVRLPCNSALQLQSTENMAAISGSSLIATATIVPGALIVFAFMGILFLIRRWPRNYHGTASGPPTPSVPYEDEEMYQTFTETLPQVYVDRLPLAPPGFSEKAEKRPTKEVTFDQPPFHGHTYCNSWQGTDAHDLVGDSESYADLSMDDRYQINDYAVAQELQNNIGYGHLPQDCETTTNALLCSLLDNVPDDQYDSEGDDSDMSKYGSVPSVNDYDGSNGASSSGYSARTEKRSFDC